jgi:hypothetical protein
LVRWNSPPPSAHPECVTAIAIADHIEGAIELLKSRKSALAEALFANSAKTPLDLTEADISALFTPLDHRATSRG